MIDFADVADLGAARMIVDALNAEIRALQDELRETRAQLPEGYADAERPHLRVKWGGRYYELERVITRRFDDWGEAREHYKTLRADRIMAAVVQTAEGGLVS